MLWPQTIGPSGGGIDIPQVVHNVRKRGGDGVIGQLCVLDLSNADAAVDNNSVGEADSGLRSVRVPVAGDQNAGVACVLTKAVTDDQDVDAVFVGRVKALVQKNSGNIAAGDPLYIGTSTALDADSPGVGKKIVAIALEAVTGPSSATLADVWIGHFGSSTS